MVKSFARSLSFRTQTVAVFGGVVVAVVATLSIVLGTLTAQTARTEADGALEAVSNDAQRILSRGMHRRLAIVTGLASLPGLWEHGLDSVEVANALAQQQATTEYLAWIGVVDPNGVVRTATGGLLVGNDVSARPWFIAGREGRHVGDVHQALLLAKLLPGKSAREPQRFVDFAMPLTVDGKAVGVIGLHGSFDWITSVVESVLPKDAAARHLEVYILDRAGTVIYTPAGAGDMRVGDRFEAAANASDTTAAIRWPDGRTYLTSVSQLQSLDPENDLRWKVVTRVPTEIAFAPVRTAVAGVVAAGVVATVLAVALAWFASGSVSGPLTAIASAAVAVERGEPGARIPPFRNNVELQRLSDALIAMTSGLEDRVRERTLQLQDANERLARIARFDALTDLLNRRGFDEQMALAVAQARRRGSRISVIAIDIDHFKQVNDRFGHATGDVVLVALAAIIRERFRTSDILARVGGEEFMVLLPDTSLAGAEEAARSFVERVAATDFPVVGRVTVSCGVSALVDGADGTPSLNRADRALYRAKAEGRNRAVMLATVIET